MTICIRLFWKGRNDMYGLLVGRFIKRKEKVHDKTQPRDLTLLHVITSCYKKLLII